MSKGLEALKEIREHLYGDVYSGVERRLNIIETALKKQEQDQKKLKALEIIKNKKVDVSYIIENPEEENVIWYNARFMGVLCEGWRMLSQEEYDLVRKVLL